ncbi:MAG: NAD(P)-dependent oxidoreductase [Bilophila wadsworthia]
MVVYDINPASVRKFVDMGASSAATVKELAAQVDVCITCVPMPKDAKGVLLGPDGVFENLPEGGVHFDLSTLDIETVVMLEAEAAKLGKKYLVIPMGKGPAFAADGTCPLFGGGDKATYDKYEECLLKKMGKPAYIGDVKAGCALKAHPEPHGHEHQRRLLRKHQSSPSSPTSPRNSSSNRSPIQGLLLPVQEHRFRHLRRDFEHPVFTVNLAFKDVRLGIEMCESFGQRVPMMSRAREVFAATAEKYGEENFTATFKML